METSELTDTALDWAVAIALGIPQEELYISGREPYRSLFRRNRDEDGNLDGTITTGPNLLFSRKWEAGGQIIEREWICADRLLNGKWMAAKRTDDGDSMLYAQSGATPLIAAMRCYVASKMGDEVEIPKELR